jgi:hypothetical protein
MFVEDIPKRAVQVDQAEDCGVVDRENFVREDNGKGCVKCGGEMEAD